MPSTFQLPYGRAVLPFTFTTPPDIYAARQTACRIDGKRFVRRVRTFLSAADIDLASAAIVVADKTRLCGYTTYLPLLVKELCRHGAAPEGLTLWIAYGTHARQSVDESRKAYGPAFDRNHWIHHRCDGRDFVRLGETSRGTPVLMPRALLSATCIITFGAVSHHYFAGFGGGRKLIFPGLGQRSAIYANHALFLDRQARRLAAGCRPGVLDGNPLAEDLAEVEALRPADLAIHGILDQNGRLCDLLVGRGNAHFRSACAVHARQCEVDRRRRYTLVVAGAGGYPKDINFIQSHKAIHHAADFVADGGQLVVLAQCRDGVGSDTFLPWFDPGGWDAAFDRLSRQYAGNGGTALAMMEKSRRIHIGLVTDLDAASTARMGVQRWSPEKVQRAIGTTTRPWALIPNAGMVIAKPSAGLSW